MAIVSRFAASTLVAILLGCASGAQPPVGTDAPAARRIAVRELVYVAGSQVRAYDAASSGAVDPILTIGDPKLPSAIWDPWTLAIDRNGYLYVQSFLSEATDFVYAPGSYARPARVFAGGIGEPDVVGVAVDSRGYEYVAPAETQLTIYGLPPRADGRAVSSYYVKPLRAIPTPSYPGPWPCKIAVDSRDELVAVVGQHIEIFAAGPDGGRRPLRVLAGSKTGLHGQIVVATARGLHFIYAGVSSGASAHISVFDENAGGNTAPLRTISGSATQLASRAIGGLAVSPRNGAMYALVASANANYFAGPAQIDVYAAGSAGNVAPRRTFADARTHFKDAAGGILVVTDPAPPLRR
jgi:hypothetical protein